LFDRTGLGVFIEEVLAGIEFNPRAFALLKPYNGKVLKHSMMLISSLLPDKTQAIVSDKAHGKGRRS
jgi:hypothetical protein